MSEDKSEPRAERLKAALRANLRRRKAQERGRAAPDTPSVAQETAAAEPVPHPGPDDDIPGDGAKTS